MTRECYTVPIIDYESNQCVDAIISSPINDKNLEDFYQTWKPELDMKKLTKKGYQPAEDSHWDWGKKVKLLESLLAYKSFAIEAEDITQGLMIIETTQHFSKLEPSKNLIYIEYLASAPWNRRELAGTQKYKRIGSVLVKQAIGDSHVMGFEGRVGLLSLPRACSFYQNCGFKDLGFDHKHKMHYFELPKNKISDHF